MQAFRVRCSNLNPGLQDAGQVPHDDRGLIRIGQALGECNAFGVLETVGQQASQEMIGSRGRGLRCADRQRFVDRSVRVGQPDVEHMHRRGLSQSSLLHRATSASVRHLLLVRLQRFGQLVQPGLGTSKSTVEMTLLLTVTGTPSGGTNANISSASVSSPHVNAAV